MNTYRAKDIRYLSHYHRSSGFSLIELLMSVLVTVTGLVGILQMEMKSVRWNNDAQLRAIAMLQVHQLVERMHANKAGILAGDYSNRSGIPSLPHCKSSAKSTAVSCSASQMAQYDIAEWNTENALKLPNGSGTISSPSNGVYTITVNWQEMAASGAVMTDFSFDFSPLP